MTYPRKPLFWTFAALCLTLAGLSQSASAQQTSPLAPLPPSDGQVWNETQIFVPVTPKLDLVLLQFGRFGGNDGYRHDLRTGIGTSFKLNKYYSVQPTWVYQYARPGEGRKSYSHRFFVDNNFKVPLEKVTIPARVRVERLVRHGRPDAWNFRFRPGIEVPVSVGGQKVTLFANNETFYDTGFKAWTRNRLLAGVSKKFSNSLTVDFFYLHQDDGFATPGDLRGFGTIVKIRFHRGKK